MFVLPRMVSALMFIIIESHARSLSAKLTSLAASGACTCGGISVSLSADTTDSTAVMWSLCHSAVHDSPVSYLRSICAAGKLDLAECWYLVQLARDNALTVPLSFAPTPVISRVVFIDLETNAMPLVAKPLAVIPTTQARILQGAQLARPA